MKTIMSGSQPIEQLKNQAQRAEAVTKAQAQAGVAPPVVPRPILHYRVILFQGYVVSAAIIFAVLFFYARTIAYFSFDLKFERLVQSFNPAWFAILMQKVSDLGFAPLVWIWSLLLILLVFLFGLRWEAVMLTFAGVGVSLLGAAIKIIVQRQRPTSALVNVFSPLTDYSFPSGHVLFFTAFLGFTFFLIYSVIPHSTRRTLGLVIVGALIALVGISRIYLGQHWPSDVIAAYLLGSLWLTLSVYIYRWGKPRFFVHQPKAPASPPSTNPQSL